MLKISWMALGPAVILAGCSLDSLTSTITGNATAINTVAAEVCGTLPEAGKLLTASQLAAAQKDCAATNQGAAMGAQLTQAVQAALNVFEANGWTL